MQRNNAATGGRRLQDQFRSNRASTSSMFGSTPDEEFDEDALERHGRGDAFYWALDRRPWDSQDGGAEDRKRGRPKGKKNKEKKASDSVPIFHAIENVCCSVCNKYKAKFFIDPCGHGMLCLLCIGKVKVSKRCFNCFTAFNDGVEFNIHRA